MSSRVRSRSSARNSRSSSRKSPRSSSKSQRKSGFSVDSSPSSSSSSNDSLISPFSSLSQYLCDSILGVNDGLVSIFLLLVGTAAASNCSSTCLLSGIAGAVAGAFSMGIGEYLATKSQIEALEAEFSSQRSCLLSGDYRTKEISRVLQTFSSLGYNSSSLVEQLQSCSIEQILQWRRLIDCGMSESHQRNPFMAMIMAGGLFFVGSLPPVIPFIILNSALDGLYWSALFTGSSLFLVGALKTTVTRGDMWFAGLENLVLCGVSAVIAWFVGSALEHLTGIKAPIS
jgi:VIT1/CCC1 family predicted Fe2+/Mn2+ transporter